MTDKKLETAALRVNELAADRGNSGDNFSRRSVVRALALGSISVTGGFSALRTLMADDGAIVPNALNLALKPAFAQATRELPVFLAGSGGSLSLQFRMDTDADDDLTGVFGYNRRTDAPEDFYWDEGNLGHIGRNPGPYTEGQNPWKNPERVLFDPVEQQPHGFSDMALPRLRVFHGSGPQGDPDFLIFPVVGGVDQNFMRGILIAHKEDLTTFKFYPLGPTLAAGDALHVAYTDGGEYKTQLIGTMATEWSGFNGVKVSGPAFGDDFITYADFSDIFPALQSDIGRITPDTGGVETPGPGDGDGNNPGDGDGNNPGDGDGNNPGDGDGNNPGDGDGNNPGDGDGNNPGDGDGNNPGDSDGNNPGDGDGNNPGDGDGNNPGDGDGNNPGDGDTDDDTDAGPTTSTVGPTTSTNVATTTMAPTTTPTPTTLATTLATTMAATTMAATTTSVATTTVGAIPGDIMFSPSAQMKRQMETVIEGTRLRLRTFRSRNRNMRDF